MTNKIVTDEKKEKEIFLDRLFELERRARKHLAKKLSVTHVLDDLQAVIEKVTANGGETQYSASVKSQWKRAYRSINIDANFQDIGVIVEHQGYWPIIMIGNVTESTLLWECYRKWSSRFYYTPIEDLVKKEIKEIGRPDKRKRSYVIYVRANTEADSNLRGLSSKDLLKKGIPCISLREHLVLKVWYFEMTKKHLDVEGSTLCAGTVFINKNNLVPAASYGCDRENFDFCFDSTPLCSRKIFFP